MAAIVDFPSPLKRAKYSNMKQSKLNYAAFEIISNIDEEELAIRKLKKFYDIAEIKPNSMSVIYGVGDQIKQRDDGIYVFPLTALKE